jgi:HemY protein
MRKFFIFCLIGLLLGVGLVALIEVDPGYVLLSFSNYTVETSFWVGLFCLGIFTSAIYLMLQLWRKFWGGKDSLTGWLGARQARQSAKLTNRGLISFIEGNWGAARRQLLRGAQGNEAPLINYLVAARASYQLNEPEKMREYLGSAESSEADAGIAIELTQAEMKIGGGQYEQALATLVRARRDAGKHPYVLDLLRKVYEGLKDWDGLAELLPELKKYKVVDEADFLALESTVHTQLFQSAVSSGDAEKTNEAWEKLPSKFKKKPELQQQYVTSLINLKEHAAAEKFIQRSLKQNWNSSLAHLYAFVDGSNASKQLAHAETWLKAHDQDAQLQMCLGRLAAKNELWGKARDYFENSFKLVRSSETCAELGRLLENLGEAKVSAAYYREGLMLKESGLPELPMPDKADPVVKRLASA